MAERGELRLVQARAAWSDREGYALTGEREHRGTPLCGSYGVYAVPPAGEEAVLLAGRGLELALGTVWSPGELGLEPGEVLLRSQGGAYLRLRNDGTVELNGLEIGPGGELRPKREG